VVVVIVLAMTHGHHLAKYITVDFGSNRQHCYPTQQTMINHIKKIARMGVTHKNIPLKTGEYHV
jgi:hypothetical protein